MKDIVLNSLVKNFKDDFGFEPSFTIKKYSQFDNFMRSTLRDKAKINQLREEKLKTEAMLADLKNRNFGKEISKAFSFALSIITIILAVGEITNSYVFYAIAIIEAVLLCPCAILSIICAKGINRRINYYNRKLEIIDEVMKNKNCKRINVKLKNKD